MSIDRETFENASEEELREVSIPEQVLGFLLANRDRAFEAAEIADRTGLDRGAVGTALTRLKERELVEHRATYWAVTTEEERLRSHDGYVRATRALNEQLGAEDADEWRACAPDEPHPSVTNERE